MKRFFALILLIVFVSSTSIKLYIDFTNLNSISSLTIDMEDDTEEEKDLEKETEKDIKKDKLTHNTIVLQITNLSVTENFYIKHLYILPKPYIAAEIIPPNLA